MLRRPTRVTPAGAVALTVLLAGAGGCLWLALGTEPPRASLEDLRRRGEVSLGIANEEPYGYLDTARGELTGEAPELARVIFGRLGVPRTDAVTSQFGALIPGLRAGRFDVIAAGMYVTPARCERVAFSRPTYRIGEAFVVPRGNPLDLHSYADVAANEEATLGVVAGTIERVYARRTGVPDERVVILNDNVSALSAVRTGQVSAFAGTQLTVRSLLDKTDGRALEEATPFTQPVIDGEEVWGYGAFAFRPRDVALREAFDRELGAFLGTEAHLALVRPFGFREENLPGDVTVEELCDG
ncbi:MAG TPA: ectoine/hydroxyectoine ABC transporter substrate-binding protein EhuB [Sandaracinaceae bacterium LLY-WYZ-13_1]|nr:ectoine/hydroxyectoine ABC transporter substrate-binding protein EhuB [Sandaracinaceae bacterium LLY-WYZ-13_1]